MFLSSTQHDIHYRIRTSLSTGTVKLTVWEPASQLLAQPYLYILNYSLKTLDDAHEVLKNHLFVNGVTAANDLELPHRGCVHVLPYETWSDFAVQVEALGEERAQKVS